MNDQFSQIEKRLQEYGWRLRPHQVPLILGLDLCAVAVDGRDVVQGLALVRGEAVGTYILRVMATTGYGAQEHKAFDPRTDAVTVTAQLVVTVDVDKGLIRFWEKKKSSYEAPAEGQPATQSPPDEAQPTE